MKKFIRQYKNFINIGLVIFLVLKAISLAWNSWSALVEPFDLPNVRDIYTHSQYNLDNAEFYGNIDDDLLYQYAGYLYIHGSDPSTINPETPFMIKYLYGLGIIVFNNPIFIQVSFALFLIAATTTLTYLFTKNITISLLSASILSMDKLFASQIFQTLLDLPHSFFILLTFIFFTLFSRAKNQSGVQTFLIITSISIGATAATKFYFSAIILFISILIFTKKSWKNLLFLSLPALLTYLCLFIVYFFYHPNLTDFLSLHLDNLRLYRSYLPEYPKGELLRIIFLGEWRTWWGSIPFIKVDTWNILWPITAIITFFSPCLLDKHDRVQILPMSTFVTLYIFTNLFHLVFPRYMLSIIPLMIIITIITITKLKFKTINSQIRYLIASSKTKQ